MVKISVEIHDRELQKLLSKLSSLDLSAPMKDISIYMKSSVLKNFEAQGRPERWKPLSPEYAEWKARHGYSSKILIRKHRLMQSISARSGTNYARIFTGVDYGIYHQLGTKKMPARPFLVIQDEDVEVAKKILQSFVEKVARV